MIFKVIEDYPNYIIYENGTIIGLRYKIPLKHNLDNCGYYRVDLYD